MISIVSIHVADKYERMGLTEYACFAPKNPHYEYIKTTVFQKYVIYLVVITKFVQIDTKGKKTYTEEDILNDQFPHTYL